MQVILQATLEIWGAFFSLFMLICVMLQEPIDKKEQLRFMKLLFCTMAILTSDSMAWLFRGEEGVKAYYIVVISNFCGYLFTYLLCVSFQNYILHQVNLPRWMCIVTKVAIVLVFPYIVLLVISQFTGWFYYINQDNQYQRGSLFWLSQSYGLVVLILITVVLCMTRKQMNSQKFMALMSYVAFPFIAIVIQMVVYGFSLLNFAATLSLMWMFLVRLAEINKAILFRERKVAEKQTKIIFSQIQPHFLYNVLNSIYYLCDKEPLRAKEAIGNFADYLRGNLKYINHSDLVTFESELEHTRKYLELESIRFGDKLKCEYHIETENFRVPPLSIQPIVENAVKHGIRKKKEGGTISITAKEEENNFVVIVEDTGAGFDGKIPEEEKKGGRIGILNVKQRMYYMCGGRLEISSKKGNGTVVVFTFNKEKNI